MELERDVERDILPAAADLGLGVIVMRPLLQGRLKWILSDARCHVAIPATTSPAHMRLNAAAGTPPWFGPEERAYVARLAHV